MEDLCCPFRLDIRTDLRSDEACEIATCGLVQNLINLPDSDLFTVERSACLQCGGGNPPDLQRLQQVIPHVVFSACVEARLAGASDPRLEMLETCADQFVTSEAKGIPKAWLYSCDVILGLTESSRFSHSAVESLLRQENCVVFVHLVNLDSNEQNRSTFIRAAEIYADQPNVIFHSISPARNTFQALHQLLPHLRTEYVAIQHESTISNAKRLADAIGTLNDYAAEFFASAADYDGQILPSSIPEIDQYQHCIRKETLVMRRASLIDIGGVADRDGDESIELLFRAMHERRGIVVDDEPLVTWQVAPESEFAGPTPTYKTGQYSLRQYAIGFANERASCDVVLPFRGHLDFVEEAIEGLLNQQDTDVVIHLIDDATIEDTTDFLKRWDDHEFIRVYRNRENIGQFASFNNVAKHFESEYVAVQDGDDISLPNRIAHLVNLLRLSDADLSGGSSLLFGTGTIPDSLVHDEIELDGANEKIRMSHYPRVSDPGYFLENPTIVMRRDLFCRLGGYTDFGTTARNRTGIDTEFMIRAYLSGAKIAVTRDLVLKYRCHDTSATQDKETNFQSAARQTASAETERRVRLFRQRQFDPKIFGAMGRNPDVTERFKNGKSS